MKICLIDGCERPAMSKGLCQTHRRRQKLGLGMNARIKPKKSPNPICSIDGCGRRVASFGMCAMHYQRTRRSADLLAPPQEKKAHGSTCAAEGCERKPDRNGFCGAHYWRSCNGRDLTAPIRKRRTPYREDETCLIDGCDRKPAGLGFCKTHYLRFHERRDLNAPVLTPLKPLGIGKWRAPGGYIIVVVPSDTPGARRKSDGCYFMLEHRYVMQRVLGRPLLAKEQVHHRDGNKTNNNPMNLELRSGPHGSGISVTDGIIASLDYLGTHAALNAREKSVLSGVRRKATQGTLIYLSNAKAAA